MTDMAVESWRKRQAEKLRACMRTLEAEVGKLRPHTQRPHAEAAIQSLRQLLETFNV